MSEKTVKGKKDDLLDDGTPAARRSEAQTVEQGGSQEKAEEEISAEIGMRVKKARESLCLSHFDIYLRTGIAVEMLSQIEAGGNDPAPGGGHQTRQGP